MDKTQLPKEHESSSSCEEVVYLLNEDDPSGPSITVTRRLPEKAQRPVSQNSTLGVEENVYLLNDDDPSGPKLIVTRKTLEEKQLDHRIASQRSFQKEVVKLFTFTNISVLVIVLIGWIVDSTFISLGLMSAEVRLITTEVILVMLGAAVTQLGAGFYLASRYLFK
ncbi:MAG: hypothetical protein JXR18_12370 [Neptuniibacter sp.]